VPCEAFPLDGPGLGVVEKGDIGLGIANQPLSLVGMAARLSNFNLFRLAFTSSSSHYSLTSAASCRLETCVPEYKYSDPTGSSFVDGNND
jgi:hypothetical protein